MDTEMEFEAYSNLTDIQSFFYGQNVFLTGVTGLVGKVVLEKLLRCCPGIGMVYIHMRPKRGLTPQQRLEKLLKLDLFRECKKVFPQFFKKIQVIEGDITQHKLGVSFDDYEKLCKNVTIFIHSAASVNFNDPIKDAVNHNIRSVKNVMDMCHNMPNIKAVIHVSTAFVKREADFRVLEEIPKTKISPDQLLDALEWMDEKSQIAVTEFLSEGGLTTYLITKALGEVLVENERGDLPVALVRPAYIGATAEEPFPGWIDSLQGISGLFLAAAKGVLRCLISAKNLKINLTPVDFVANSIITSAWHVGTTRPATIFIINTVFDYETLPSANEDILQFLLDKRSDYPLVKMVRYPDFTIYYNRFAYHIHATIDQWIPAFIMDFFLFIFTGKTILFKVYRKIYFLYDIFYRLGKDPWICQTDSIKILNSKLSKDDAKIFKMQFDGFDWKEYIDTCLRGGRKYLAREDPSNIPYARKKALIWWTVTTIMKWCLILYFVYYLLNRSFFSPIYEIIEDKLHEIHS